MGAVAQRITKTNIGYILAFKPQKDLPRRAKGPERVFFAAKIARFNR